MASYYWEYDTLSIAMAPRLRATPPPEPRRPALARDVAVELTPATRNDGEPAAVGDHAAAGSASMRASVVRNAREHVKVLFFAANADKERQIAIGKEHSAIDAVIRSSRYRDKFQLLVSLEGRLSDLHQALLDHRPDIVHFSCHGNAQAELLLIQEDDDVAPVPPEVLSETLRVLRDDLVLVVFNACFSAAQAAAIRHSVGLAVGMTKPIEDSAAIAFSAALYRALAAGRSVQDAFDLAAAVIKASSRGDPMPRLSAGNGIDARAVHVVADGSRPSLDGRWVSVAAACVAVVGMVVLRWSPRPGVPSPEPRRPATATPAPRRDDPVARRGVRFAAADIRPGLFEASQRPLGCSSLGGDEDCAVLAHPERVATVHLDAFELDAVEVSNGELASWLESNRELWAADEHGRITTRQGSIALVLASDDCFGALTVTGAGRVAVSPDKIRWPAVCVTWYGAAEYCRARRKRLPLAAEWELAAKGAEGRPFPWGSHLPTADGVAFDLRDGAAAHPRDVGSSPEDVSPEGVHDLGGNVAEWVDDSPGMLGTAMIRGGSWASRGPCHLLGSGCKRIAADKHSGDVGFRCASRVAAEESTGAP